MTTTNVATVSYDYAEDGWSVLTYEADRDDLIAATDYERRRGLEQLPISGEVVDAEFIGDESDAWRACEQKHRDGMHIVNVLGQLKLAD